MDKPQPVARQDTTQKKADVAKFIGHVGLLVNQPPKSGLPFDASSELFDRQRPILSGSSLFTGRHYTVLGHESHMRIQSNDSPSISGARCVSQSR
jgi:hypothetical protein